ncbi:MAG: hypothetical protein KatS3mg060_2937 [Dehalococcoidia bacterium]|nr:MAG: hypothetical protein KatS3mg060_2937 [Dehalococcoidia bacterium]
MISRALVPVVILLLVFAVALRLFPLALLLALLLVSSGLARLWITRALDRVEYRRHFSQQRAFFGETIELAVEAVNRKILPLPWLEVDDETPLPLPIGDEPLFPSARPRRVLLSNTYSLGPYERVTRRYRLQCRARGYWAFGPATLRSGDVFGFGQREREAPELDYLLIYPKTVPVEQLGLPAKQPFGDYRARQRLFEDPTRLRAVRPFEPGDPLKRVHWKATARTGQIQVKQFDATSTLDLYVVLNLATFDHSWQGTRPDLLETAISVAASAASHALGEGFPVGLLANGMTHGSDRPLKIAPGRGNDQLMRLLESLAKLSAFVTLSLDDLLRQERRALPWSATIVCVTAVAAEPLLAVLTALQRAGHPVVLILIGDVEPGPLPGLTVYRVSPFDPAELGVEHGLAF